MDLTSDPHLDPDVARTYDQSSDPKFDADVIGPTVDRIVELAAGGHVLEFAIGTGRIALPVAAAGVDVHGIDFSEPMVAQLRAKPGGEHIPVTIGDMASTRLSGDFSLVYLVYNSIINLTTQADQVACFRNAAAHLAAGGRFVIELLVPDPPRRTDHERFRPFDVSDEHVGIDEYLDRTAQILVSHHMYPNRDAKRTVAGRFRYVWPSELDLMAQLAGMELEHRWADWDRSEFTDTSESHVSVWRLAS
jgi:SAM-dependent methyltransferase